MKDQWKVLLLLKSWRKRESSLKHKEQYMGLVHSSLYLINVLPKTIQKANYLQDVWNYNEELPTNFKKKFIKLARIFFLIPHKTSAHRHKGQGHSSGHELTWSSVVLSFSELQMDFQVTWASVVPFCRKLPFRVSWFWHFCTGVWAFMQQGLVNDS